MRFVPIFVLLAALSACSDRTVLGPEFGRLPCRPSSRLVAMVDVEPFAPLEMRDALIHGADVMAIAIADGASRRDLIDAMRFAARDIGAQNLDGACRMVEIANVALNKMADVEDSRADRDGIQLILALTAHSLDAVVGN
jgi:hypothetical protein